MSCENRIRPAEPLPEVGGAGNSLDRFGFVTPSTKSNLDRFVALLAEWQRVHNLVSGSAMGEIWSRHVADSLQLLEHAPEFRIWVDLGSGAGFPGLVVAIAAVENPERRFILVESNHKKAAFLRAAIRQTGANAEVAAERIEEHAPKMAGHADIVSARALAPLSRICGLAAPYMNPRSALLLLKGGAFGSEEKAARKSWVYDKLTFASATDPDGQVAVIRNLHRKVGSDEP